MMHMQLLCPPEQINLASISKFSVIIYYELG
jgi:hypothetical protein